MADFHEQSIHTFSGLSTETKPTIAAGNNVPNGSRWREIDTAKVFHYNKSDDTWYWAERILEQTTHAITTVAYPHAELHAGKYFDAWHTLTGKNDGTYLTIYFKTANTDKLCHMVASWQSSGAAYFRIREFPVVTANTGSSKAIYNRFRASTNTSGVFDNATVPVVNKHMTDVTIADRTPATPGVTGGEVIFEEYDGIGKQSPGGGREMFERKLLKNTAYVYEVESDAAGLVLALQLGWYEHTDKA